MAKFSQFNTYMSNKSRNDEEENEEDKKEEDEGKEEEEVQQEAEDEGEVQAAVKEETVIPTHIKEEEPLAQEYVDQTYWKVDLMADKSLDDLMAEMELWLAKRMSGSQEPLEAYIQ